MSFTEKTIFELLPAYYRSKDIEQGSPLQALINIIAGKAVVVENNIGQLYDNWFIETCEEWVVPYIGDLLGVQNFTAIAGSSALSQRGYVANTLGYRRRKGIAPILEQLSRDIAGWPAHVVEFFQLLATTQYMNHIRLDHPVSPDLRSMEQLDLVNSAFDTIAHTVDTRHISAGRGKYNISNIGLFIWRLQSYKVTLANAALASCLSSPPGSYFTFSPLGYTMQLFNNPRTETAITHISDEIDLPALLRRRALFDELEARRLAIVNNQSITFNYFDNTQEVAGDASTQRHPVFEIFPNDKNEPVPPEEILICNLEECCTPPKTVSYPQLQNDGTSIPKPMAISVAVDPVTGKFIFTDPAITAARVSYSYGFSGDTGSGTYNRQDAVASAFQSAGIIVNSADPQNTLWQAGVSKTIPAVGTEEIFTNVQDALNAWNSSGQPLGIICIMDNAIYEENLNILIPEKSQLFMIAADWPAVSLPDSLPGQLSRVNANIVADNLQPVLKGDILIQSIAGSPPDFDTKTGGVVNLNGLLINGKLTVPVGNLGALNLGNCTLVPVSGGIDIGGDTFDSRSNQWLQIKMQNSICGPVNLHDTQLESTFIENSVIDNPADWAIISNEAPLQLNCTTVLGKTAAKSITADNSIFNETIIIERTQTGCIRFSFVPYTDYKTAPQTPRRFHCQPELEMNTQIENAKKSGSLLPSEDDIRKTIFESIVPAFTSTSYGHHAYAQLNVNCPPQISTGGDDGAEMGVFNFLKQPQRKANLLIALNEYVRLGLEAGIFYAT